MREVVTLQLGHLSNFVATHFWNAQVCTHIDTFRMTDQIQD